MTHVGLSRFAHRLIVINHIFVVFVEMFMWVIHHIRSELVIAVSHNEWLQVDRIPAILELCIHAGVDIPEYPTRRRDFPVYRVAGKIIDFEKKFPENDLSGNDINHSGFWGKKKKKGLKDDQKSLNLPYDDLKGFADQGMEVLEKFRCGVIRLMKKYAVKTCGEATFDDLFPPVYVWHVPKTHNTLLIDGRKIYYGKLPALVEMFAQAGAEVGENYRGMMIEDVVVPSLGEDKLVV
ncbi:hypothetical protein ACS0TY_027881 [Phlomoides rotata]